MDQGNFVNAEGFGAFEMQVHEAYGVFDVVDSEGQHFSLVSAKSFEDFVVMLDEIDDTDGFVLSPELITITGFDFIEIPNKRGRIEERIGEVVKLSATSPQKTILLGTPYWLEDSKKPVNAVVAIRNGEIVSVIPKITNVDSEEYEVFDFGKKDIPQSVDSKKDVGILICSDLGNASSELDLGDAHVRDFLARNSFKWVLTHKMWPQFVNSSWRTIVVPAVWGVGGHPHWVGAKDFDDYYRRTLFSIVDSIFKRYPNVMDIIVCDRSLYGLVNDPNISKVPFNYHFRRA